MECSNAPLWCIIGLCVQYMLIELMNVCPLVCLCVSPCVAKHTWRMKDPQAHQGPISPSLFRKACSLPWAGGGWGDNTPQLANFICCHFLSFPLSLSSWNAVRHKDFPWCAVPHACEAQIGCIGLFKVSKLSALPGMFSLSSCVVLVGVKINQTYWFIYFFYFFSLHYTYLQYNLLCQRSPPTTQMWISCLSAETVKAKDRFFLFHFTNQPVQGKNCDF